MNYCSTKKLVIKMENKIIIEGKEFDLPQSLVDEIKEKLTEKKELTYQDVVKELFKNKPLFYINYNGRIEEGDCRFSDPNNATSKRQLEKLLAINKLMNVAKFLNGNWIYHNGNCPAYSIHVNYVDKIYVTGMSEYKTGDIYFKSLELAKRAIKILGEDVIRLVLATDY